MQNKVDGGVTFKIPATFLRNKFSHAKLGRDNK
jgi:hypothetical protein